MTAVAAALVGPSVLYLLLVTAGLVRQLTAQAELDCQFAAITARYEET